MKEILECLSLVRDPLDGYSIEECEQYDISLSGFYVYLETGKLSELVTILEGGVATPYVCNLVKKNPVLGLDMLRDVLRISSYTAEFVRSVGGVQTLLDQYYEEHSREKTQVSDGEVEDIPMDEFVTFIDEIGVADSFTAELKNGEGACHVEGSVKVSAEGSEESTTPPVEESVQLDSAEEIPDENCMCESHQNAESSSNVVINNSLSEGTQEPFYKKESTARTSEIVQLIYDNMKQIENMQAKLSTLIGETYNLIQGLKDEITTACVERRNDE